MMAPVSQMNAELATDCTGGGLDQHTAPRHKIKKGREHRSPGRRRSCSRICPGPIVENQKQKDRSKKGMMKAKPSSRRSDAGRVYTSSAPQRRPRGAFLLITANYSTTVPWLNFHTPTLLPLPQSPTTAEKGEHHRSGRQTVAGGTALHPVIPIRSKNGTGSSSGKENKRSNDASSLLSRRRQHVFCNLRVSANSSTLRLHFF